MPPTHGLMQPIVAPILYLLLTDTRRCGRGRNTPSRRIVAIVQTLL
jgi:hypothetical protein